ncbi:uncharacterized protein LOC108961079 isoform X3 [Eucalyptus grandis]|uniref:uncharacterized protein LOC108961079 isoform X3 n=1 Tax=Eucalyptus grandis TaxID=71139 RepID=UPI00192EE080|nr:uncharacterized protein LOC108961079 isoform X3 [Eucalyptus grandis]
MVTVIIPENLPVGYRFHPTDEELVDHYLKLKVLGFIDNICIIPEVDICKWEPWELAQRFKEQSVIPSDDKVQEWWFFCPQMQRIQRSTCLGYWKKTGVDRTIKARDKNRAIGTKKTLVFHEGRSSKGMKTNWVVHEYHLLTDNLDELFPYSQTNNYVLCRLKHKGNEKSDISSLQLKGGAISLIDLDSDLHQPEHNSFPDPWIQAMGNSSINLIDLDSDLHQPEHEYSFPEPWIQAVGNSPIGLVNLDSDLHQPEHENSTEDSWIQAVGNSLISSVDLHSDLQQPEHGNSFSEATTWVDEPTHIRSPTFADFSVDNGVAFTDESDQLQFDYFDIDQMQTMELTHIRSSSFADFSVDNGVAITDEPNQLQFDYFDSDQMQTQYGAMHSSDDELAVLMKSWQTQTIKSLYGVIPLDEKKGFIENKFNGLHISSPEHMEPPKKPDIARTYSTDESRVEKVKKLELAARNIKPGCVTLDELEAKAKVEKNREHSAASKSPQNNHKKEIEQAIEKSNSMPNLRGTITDCTKISMVPSLYGQISSSRNDHATVENRRTATIETLQGQTSSSQNKNAVVETLQTRTIELSRGCGDIPLEEKKIFDGNKFNSSNVLPLKCMDPLGKPATVRIYSKDEKRSFLEVKKQELAARNIKPDCVSLDDSATKAKSHNEHAVLVDNPQIGTVEPLNGVASLHEKNGFNENKFDSLHFSSTKHMELPGVRIYCKGEKPRFEKFRKEDLPARDIKSVYIPLDGSAVIAKHDQASGLHKDHIIEENGLIQTNKLLDVVIPLEGKKGGSKNEFNRRRIVSTKWTEHPEKAANAGISCKYEDPRLEKLKMPEFSAREISNQKVYLWLNQQPDQRGESNKHREETEPAREISISATPLTGSTTKHAEIYANPSTFKITTRYIL